MALTTPTELKVARAILSDSTLREATALSGLTGEKQAAVDLMEREIDLAKAKCASSHMASVAKFAPTIEFEQELQAQAHAKIDELCAIQLNAALTAHRKSAAHITHDDILALCALHDIVADVHVMQNKGITGAAFIRLRNETHVASALGIKEVGDCRRMLHIINRMVTKQSMPMPINIQVDGDVNEPSKWSVGQVGQWAGFHGLSVIAPALKKHKIAGDVLLDLNLDVVTVAMDIPFEFHAVFEDEITALKDRRPAYPASNTLPSPISTPVPTLEHAPIAQPGNITPIINQPAPQTTPIPSSHEPEGIVAETVPAVDNAVTESIHNQPSDLPHHDSVIAGQPTENENHAATEPLETAPELPLAPPVPLIIEDSYNSVDTAHNSDSLYPSLELTN